MLDTKSRGLRHQTRSRRSKPTLHGARVLDTKSRATSKVWWRVAPGGGACPSCVAVLQRRLGHDASDLPLRAADALGPEAAARGSRGAGLRATPAVLRDSTGPVAEAEEREWLQEETERSGGATGELSTERPVGSC